MAAVVGALASLYIVSMFLRNSIGVIAPDLARDLGLSASDLGLLSSIFFFTFAAAQIPLGVALDRFGPKRCMLVCAALVVAAAAMFAWAPSPAALVAARALLGIGSSCYLMAPLALYARRFPPERFAMLAGLQLGIGSLGAILATAPLAHLAATIGWRMSFLVVGMVMLACALVTAFVVRENPHDAGTSAGPEGLAESIAGLIQVMRTRGVWRLFAMNFAGMSSFALIAGLWGGPYLTHVYGYDLRGRGDVLLVTGLAQVLGMLAWGSADRLFGSFRIPVVLGAGSVVAMLAILAAAGEMSTPALLVWLAVFGAVSAFSPVLISHGKTLFPPHLVGRGITLLNLAAMLGTFTTQFVSGFIMDLFWTADGTYPLIAYRTIFALQALLGSVSILIYFGAGDPVKSSVERV